MTASQNKDSSTHFGFETVPVSEKAKKVAAVFHRVAERYDLMNDLMSFGIHRLWKHLTIEIANIREGQRVLDLAGGSGDLTRLLLKKVGTKGHVVLADINDAMLNVGRDRLMDEGLISNLSFVQADAEKLPLANGSFDAVVIGFGLRNVTNKQAALNAMYRVLKPGGKVMILEFSEPLSPFIKKIYDAYSFHLLPKIGEWISNDSASYRYLAESIRMHPSREEQTKMMEIAGFEDCVCHNMSCGIVALHVAYRY